MSASVLAQYYLIVCMDSMLASCQNVLACLPAGVCAHPLRAALLNVAYGKRVQNYRDIGYFPKVEFPSTLKKGPRRQVRLWVISKCLTHLLRTMKENSFNGKPARDNIVGTQCTRRPALSIRTFVTQ